MRVSFAFISFNFSNNLYDWEWDICVSNAELSSTETRNEQKSLCFGAVVIQRVRLTLSHRSAQFDCVLHCHCDCAHCLLVKQLQF